MNRLVFGGRKDNSVSHVCAIRYLAPSDDVGENEERPDTDDIGQQLKHCMLLSITLVGVWSRQWARLGFSDRRSAG
jgi:hypothetical protein